MKAFFKFALITSLILGAGLAIYTWYEATHFSLKNFLQKILDDNHIPVTIHKIEIRGKTRDIINDLLAGEIDHFTADVEHTLLKQRFKLTTPIHYKLEKDRITIHAEPAIENRMIGVMKSKIDTIIAFERKTALVDLQEIHLGLEFHSAKPLQLSGPPFPSEHSLQLGSYSGKASFVIDPQTTSKEHVLFQSTLSLNEIIFETKTKSYNQKQIAFTLHGLTNGTDISNLEFKISRPLPFVFRGGYANGKLKLSFNHSNPLQDTVNVLNELLQSPFLNKIESTDSKITLAGNIQFDSKDKTSVKISTDFNINAQELIINNLAGNMNLKNSKLNLEGRFNYPIRWEEGQLNVETAKLGQFKTMPFKINFVIHPNGINNKLEGMLSIPAFGSAVALSNLEIYIPFSPSNEFYEEYSLPGISFPATIRTSVSAGPFDLPLLQKKLCVLDTKPLKGNVSIHYKDVYNRFGAFELKGDGKGEILGGNFNLENLSYHFDRDNPLLDVNLSLTDLDLQEIGKYTNLGDMRGSLDIELKDASYALTSIGPIPLAYDFTVKGRKRSEKTISFYGRAVDNILEMLGSRKADMPWIARTVINIGMSFRNWFPATADYMGFHAKTSSGWTELRTFDPVLNSLDEKIESHYLLYGTAFKVPLNSHGVYPVMMKTEAFQRWLWGMIDYFKKISAQNADSKDILKTEEECYPFWKYDYETL